ncbi:MAG: HAD-IC family P-type ATPase, partial [Syntrophobacteraceae bacterium]|nr:HAD-IC family P-type ATPase [Syntrophobacteraceae bacterium]
TIQSLKRLVRPSAEVIRDSNAARISAEELVPGDLLVLKPGTSVGADCRLVETSHLTLDESVLTGESMPVMKSPEALTRPDIPLADRVNMVYMGTLVTGGHGIAVVVATGMYTEVGQLQMLVSEAESPETPMERQLTKIGDQLVLISGAACGIVFVVGLLRGYGFLQMFKTAISLAVAAVPEGLPAVATTTLALGIRRMRHHRVLIRKLEAVETLGCVQTICFDKTGTITLNRMSVLRVFTGMKRLHVSDGRFHAGEDAVDPLSCQELSRLIEVVVLCSETEILMDKGAYVLRGTPTENALVQMAIDCSVDVVWLRTGYPRVKTNYRSENRQFMGTLHEKEDGEAFIALKGSPTEVLAMCDRQIKDGAEVPLTEEDRLQVELENDQMAGNALRVLGVACSIGEGEEKFGAEEGFTWLGLVGMADPVRPGVRDLVARFHTAGIDTVMITGDQSATAYAIGKELDLSSGEQLEILDSTDLASADPELIRALSERVHVFSRVSPAHKLQIVRALQDTGRTVAMTGDGMNDGPALKAADIGIAMGAGGTDIAREVADLILEDDDLETMIIAVRDGRAIYNNIRKSLHFLLATNFSEIIVMLLTVAAGVGSPLNAMQLLWINLLS